MSENTVNVRAIAGQHCNVNLRNNTNHILSIFNSVRKTERSLPSSPRKKAEVIAKKFSLRVAGHKKSGRKKNELSEEEEEWIENFLETVCIFQSIKSPVELSSLLSKFFCYITWFVISPD